MMFKRFHRRQISILAFQITEKLIASYLGENTFVKKPFFKENKTTYFISVFNSGAVIISTPRGKLVAGNGDWIVKEINDNYSVYSDKEFNKLTYNGHGKKNKK